MSKVLLRGLAVPALLVLLVFTLAGCWNPFAPSKGDNDDPIPDAQYKVRKNPGNVIYNLQTSYVYMNANEYLNCLAEDFIFFLNPDDLTEFPELPEYWDKAEEEHIHRNMFGQGTDVEGIALTFTHISEVYDPGPTGDPLDDLWTYVEDIDLEVNLPPDLTLHAQAPAEFLFRVDPDEVGPEGETLWEIWKQWDLNEEKRGDDGYFEDGISLTRLKATFRE
jgi:hypothetical protein